MARSTQYFGLSDDAKQWMKENLKSSIVKIHTIYEFEDGHEQHCNSQKVEFIAELSGESISGVFDEPDSNLHKFECLDGTWVEEFLQDEVWNSGPMLYIALRDCETKDPIEETLWK